MPSVPANLRAALRYDHFSTYTCSLFTPTGGPTRLLLRSPVERRLYLTPFVARVDFAAGVSKAPTFRSKHKKKQPSLVFCFSFSAAAFLYLLFLDGMYRPSSCLFPPTVLFTPFFFFFERRESQEVGQQYWLHAHTHTLCSHLGVFSFFFFYYLLLH